MAWKFPDLLRPFLDPVLDHPRGLGGRLGAALMARSGAQTEHYVVEQAKLAEDEVVLVVGPGPGVGLLAAAAATPNGRVIGVDPAKLMRELAEERCNRLVRAGQVTLRDGTAARTGLARHSVDVVLSVNNAHIWPDRAAGFAELFRVLRPGGRLMVSVPAGLLPDSGPEDLRREVRSAGFVDVQAYTLTAESQAGAAVQVRATAPVPVSDITRGRRL